MASKRKKPASSQHRNLFSDEDEVDESHHDPYSDVDGEFGSDSNYDPEGAQGGDTSGSDYEIFSKRNVRRMPSTRISESPLCSTDSSSNDDVSVSDEEISERPCNDLPLIENSKEEEEMGSQGSHVRSSVSESSYHHHQTGEIDLNPTTLLQNQILEPTNEPTFSAADDAEWVDIIADIPDFSFDQTLPSLHVHIDEAATEKDVFDLVFTLDLVEYIVNCTNTYGNSLVNQNRPHTRHSRHSIFHETNVEEMYKFLGLSLLSEQIRMPENRKLFTRADPLYYHPIFNYVMSGWRYEQILRCLCASELNAKGPDKINGFFDIMTENFRQVYYPDKELSLDESIMLFRGRLYFRTYMKNKKTKYGIKFYVLTSHDGYVLNQKMYCGKTDVDESSAGGKTIKKLVLRLMRPYLLKGHQLCMDNFYNSMPLPEKLLDLKTHTCGTLKSNRKGNPAFLTKEKLKKGEHFWLRKGKIYVSHWRDKRQVLMLTTLDQPEMIEVTNRRGQKRNKPKEVTRYNSFMSGIDRADQMISYYSCPRKTIRWHKKVIFHMLDVAAWNSFFLLKKYVLKNNNKKFGYVEYRDKLIRRFTKLNDDVYGKDLVSVDAWRRYQTKAPEQSSSSQRIGIGHWPVRITARETSKKKYSFLNCRICLNQEPKRRRETSYRCNGCPNSPPLCPECFEKWHSIHNYPDIPE